MNPGDGPETDQPAAAGRAARGPVGREVRETGGQVMWGVGKLLVVILAAFLGAALVEAVRAIL
jgi:hypothetical protein